MKKCFFIVLFYLAGCSTTTNIVNYHDTSNIDFLEIKNSNISIYSSSLIASIQRTPTHNYEVTPSDIINYVETAFLEIIPTIHIDKGTSQLPRSYTGKLSLNSKTEMESFLKKHESDYIFIVTNTSRDKRITMHSGYMTEKGYKAGYNTAESKINISFEVWDVKNKKIILDYEVNQKGFANVKKSIYKAVEFINNNGHLNE